MEKELLMTILISIAGILAIVVMTVKPLPQPDTDLIGLMVSQKGIGNLERALNLKILLDNGAIKSGSTIKVDDKKTVAITLSRDRRGKDFDRKEQDEFDMLIRKGNHKDQRKVHVDFSATHTSGCTVNIDSDYSWPYSARWKPATTTARCGYGMYTVAATFSYEKAQVSATTTLTLQALQAPSTLMKGLVREYQFDNQNNPLIDSINAKDGTNAGGVLIEGKSGTALHFANGAYATIPVGSDIGFKSADKFTIAAWINTNCDGSGQCTALSYENNQGSSTISTNPILPLQVSQVPADANWQGQIVSLAYNGYLYVTGWDAGAYGSLTIFDVNGVNESAPVQVSYQNNASFYTPSGLVVVGDYMYMVAGGSSSYNGLITLDISGSNAVSPVVLNRFYNSTSFSSAPRGIISSGNYLYVRTNTGLVTFDISGSNSVVPLQVNYQTNISNTQSGNNRMVITSTNLYIVKSNAGIQVFDISGSNASAPVYVNLINSSSLAGVWSIYSVGDYLYAYGATNYNLVTLDISGVNAASPVQVANYVNATSLPTAMNAWESLNGYLYIGGAHASPGYRALTVFDISGSNASNPVQVSSDLSFNGSEALEIIGSHLYSSSTQYGSSNPMLTTYDVSSSNPYPTISNILRLSIANKPGVFADSQWLLIPKGTYPDQRGLTYYGSGNNAPNNNLADGTWHSIILTFYGDYAGCSDGMCAADKGGHVTQDGITYNETYPINGISIPSKNTMIIDQNSGVIYLGLLKDYAISEETGNPLEGAIDDLCIWKRALNPVERAQLASGSVNCDGTPR